MDFINFKQITEISIPRFNENHIDEEQGECVAFGTTSPLFIVAGPGTGKTTVLSLRALKLVFVDHVRPEEIVATTFTRKAAKELRSRILSWGYSISEYILKHYSADSDDVTWLKSIDLNAIITGTIDSLIAEFLQENKVPGEIQPVLADEMVLKSILGNVYRRHHTDQPFYTFMRDELNPAYRHFGYNTTSIISDIFSLYERLMSDDVDVEALKSEKSSEQLNKLLEIIGAFGDELSRRNICTYARLSSIFYSKLINNEIPSITEKISALLIDEYQDTNYIQERIYFELCRKTHCSLTVVGDDDQSIFRFRGATVELFHDFSSRLPAALNILWTPKVLYLSRNYRSTPEIVSCYQTFIRNDIGFSSVRIPQKPLLTANNPSMQLEDNHYPVLGLFRDSLPALASAIFSLLNELVNNGIYKIPAAGRKSLIIKANPSFNWGDAVLLSHSSNELSYSNKTRLPKELYQIMDANNVHVFNPRGKKIPDLSDVQVVLGLVVECIDPNLAIFSCFSNGIVASYINVIQQWLQTSNQFRTENPELNNFVYGWQTRSAENGEWPDEYPIIELIYKLASLVKDLFDTPEGQIYLEVISRAVSNASQVFSDNGSFNKDSQYSIKNFYENIVFPLIDGNIAVNEDIMAYIPRNYFPMMTIHQSKGLEFPVVFVDIGSEFKGNYPAQRFKRFPECGDSTHVIEEYIANCSPISRIRMLRNNQQRAYDDLKRLYFVADSRAQYLLVLVGLSPVLRRQSPIPAIQTGYTTLSHQAFHFIEASSWPLEPDPANILLI